jgi:aspartate aminotransferase
MGYAVGPREIIQTMTKLQGQMTTNINSATQWACVAALNGPQDFLKKWVSEFQKRRDYIVEGLNAIPGVSCFKPQGAFYVFPNISAINPNAESLCELLLQKAHVACVPGTGFGMEGFIRLSYATSMSHIEEGLKRIRGFVA